MNLDMSMNRRALLRAGLSLAITAATPRVFAGAAKGFFAAHQLPLGLQLYVLGEAAAKDLETTLIRVAKIGYRTIEGPGALLDDPARSRGAADKAGLAVTSVHLAAQPMGPGILTLHDDTALIVARLRTLGCSDVVVPFPIVPPFKPEAGADFGQALVHAVTAAGADPWKRTAAFLNERGEALRREGVSLSYHNHDLDFLPIGKTSGWDILLKETDPKLVSFEVDVGWVVAAGIDPIGLLRGLTGRVRQIHVKDLRGRPKSRSAFAMDPTEVGSGIIDWKKVLPAAYAAGARQFYVEQEPPYRMDRFDAAAKSYAFLMQV